MRTVFAFLALTLAACSSPTSNAASAPSSDIPPEARVQAGSVFTTRCTPCHGSSGGGDGPASASLSPRPRNFTDRTWQKGVTDDHLEKIIQYGGGAVGKSPNMPANPDLQSKPLVVKALVERIRGFGG